MSKVVLSFLFLVAGFSILSGCDSASSTSVVAPPASVDVDAENAAYEAKMNANAQ